MTSPSELKIDKFGLAGSAHECHQGQHKQQARQEGKLMVCFEAQAPFIRDELNRLHCIRGDENRKRENNHDDQGRKFEVGLREELPGFEIPGKFFRDGLCRFNAKHCLDHTVCLSDAWGLKIDPGEIYEQERAESSAGCIHCSSRYSPCPVKGEGCAMEGSPDDKGPARAVPYTSQKKGNEYVREGSCRPFPAAAKRNIEIIPEPA